MPKTIVLPERLPSAAIEDLVTRLSKATGPKIGIDARKVHSIGARAAEILVRFADEHEAANRSVLITPSERFLEDIRILGLEHRLPIKELTT